MSKIKAVLVVVVFLGFIAAFSVSWFSVFAMAIPVTGILGIGIKKIMSA